MSQGDWSDGENDLIVADHFSMLEMDLSGEPYSKAEHSRRLGSLLKGRSEGSIEFKHRNISAVLLGLGQPWIEGYKPASRFQGSLVDAVLRWLDARQDWLSPGAPRDEAVTRSFADGRPLWIGPPPTHANQPPPIDLSMLDLIARKCDVAARDARNRALGKAGEELVFGSERATLRSSGRRDLAEQVRGSRATMATALATTSPVSSRTANRGSSRSRQRMVGNARRSTSPETNSPPLTVTATVGV